MAWLRPTASPPAMYGRATLAIEVSSTSMNVASVTVKATIQWLTGGLDLGPARRCRRRMPRS